MATFAPARLVKGAARRPLPFGLFSVVDFDTPAEPYWQAGGVEWDVEARTTLGAVGHPTGEGETTPPGSPSAGVPKQFPMNYGTETALPFSVYGHWKTSPMVYTPEEAQFKALEHLTAFEETQVEKELWTGTISGSASPNLSNPAPTDLGSGTSAIALGLLEDHIATTYGSLGVIHMARSVASRLLADDLLESKGSRLQTLLGTPVVAGVGYAKTDIRATPALFGLRSEVFFSSRTGSPLLDTVNNDLYAIAERSYLIGFDNFAVAKATLS